MIPGPRSTLRGVSTTTALAAVSHPESPPDLTRWCVFVEVLAVVDGDLDTERARIVQAVEDATGLRPRTRTIREDALNAAWAPFEPFKEHPSGQVLQPRRRTTQPYRQ